MNTIKVGSKDLPVIGYVETKETGPVPLVDAPMMSDYTWNMLALRSRLNDLEFYRTVLGEDVEAVIAKLRETLTQYDKYESWLAQVKAVGDMKGKVTAINSARPERWTISVGEQCDNSICCFYQERGQCWAGMVEVDSLDKLSKALTRAKGAMQAARKQNTRIEVAV